jgi:hypothetical protein
MMLRHTVAQALQGLRSGATEPMNDGAARRRRRAVWLVVRFSRLLSDSGS